MPEYLVPGLFIEELSSLPPPVAEVETALPVFIGYTAQATLTNAGDLSHVPHRIHSFVEFEACYGEGAPCTVKRVDLDGAGKFISADLEARHFLFDAMRLFFANGGGDCYVVSVGPFPASGKAGIKALMSGLKAVAAVDGPSLLLFPDAATLSDTNLGKLQRAALGQCAQRQDRFAVFDFGRADASGARFRENVGVSNLKYGAAYTPWLLLHPARPLGYAQLRGRIFQNGRSIRLQALASDQATLALLARLDALCASPPAPDIGDQVEQAERALYEAFPVYRDLLDGVQTMTFDCPPSGAVVGIYARTDRERGVWKAPANTVVNGIAGLAASFTKGELELLAVDSAAGKSINPVRQLAGKGWQVWGARTLAGNDNEWRYVPVRRFFIMVEASLREATARFVFEPNDANTWRRVHTMIEDFLLMKWREGALLGARPDQAFFIKCGAGETMTALDVSEGRLIVEVGLAMVRPAEFIILRFVQLLQAA